MAVEKACKVCGIVGHSATFCFHRKRTTIRTRKPIRKLGKVGQKWLRVREQWFVDNPAPFYHCYICGDQLTKRETTLDHVLPRSHAPELRYDPDNLKPCCYRCNTNKGSKHP